MPAIWTFPLLGIDITQVRLQQLHGAMSREMDREHKATRKDWSLGALGIGPEGLPRVVVRTLTTMAVDVLRQWAVSGAEIRLGRQVGAVADHMVETQAETWASLAVPRQTNTWVMEFLAPTSMAEGSWYSPLIKPDSLLVSLLMRWNAAITMETEQTGDNPLAPGAPMTELAQRRWTREALRALHVTDIEGQTIAVRIPRLKGGGHRIDKVVPGFVGRMAFRASSQDLAMATDSLFRFAEYCGVGAEVNHGMGSVRLLPD